MKKVLLGLGSLVAAFVFTGCVASTEPSYGYYGYSDYPATYVTPVQGQVYIEGDWYNDGGHWRQHPGHWERPPYHGARYHNGYWGHGHSEWHRGEWR
jgi:hypothetical protein